MKKFSIVASVLALSCSMSALAYTGASDWAKAELEKAEKYALIPNVLSSADVSKPITRSEFASLSVKLFEALGKTEIASPEVNPFADTSDEQVLKAYAAGITTGTSDTTFEPDALLSREQAATMLARTYSKSMNAEAKPTGAAQKFKDDDNISDWAKESVYFMVENGIINGIGEGVFAPQNVTPEQEVEFYANSTREQSVTIAVRMYEKFSKAEAENTSSDLIKNMPAHAFGNALSESVTEKKAEYKFENVAVESYAAYAATVRSMFPEVSYELNEAVQKALKASNGEYQIFIQWSNDGAASIKFEKLQ